jgi:hypothetical protein
MVCHYILLFFIIRYYDAIMTVIAIIALIAQFSVGEVSIFWELNAGMGSTPRVSCWRRLPANWSPRSVKDMDLEFLGSAHGLPTDETCLRWMSMACRDSNSLLQWAHLKPNVSGLRVFLFQHLDACCESRCQWTCCNFPPVTQSIPIAPGAKLELNTTQKEYAQPCA